MLQQLHQSCQPAQIPPLQTYPNRFSLASASSSAPASGLTVPCLGLHLPAQNQAQLNSTRAINSSLPLSSSDPNPTVSATPSNMRSNTTGLQADIESEGYASDASHLSNASSASEHRNRERGHARSRRAIRVKSAGQPGDGYENNRTRKETHCKSLPIKDFSANNNRQDFDLWISQFEEVVNRAMNPHSRKRHHMFCLQWLSGSLETDAFAIWKGAVNNHDGADWVELKKELILAFEDPAIRANWKMDMKAYEWDEANVSLQAYCAQVQRNVDTFDRDIAETPAARAAQYYIRFLNGLPDDYVERVRMSRKTTIEKALEICICFQSVKESRTQNR